LHALLGMAWSAHLAIVATLAAVLAVSSDGHAATTLQSVTGNWKGTLSSKMADAAADIEIVMYQSGSELRGQLYCSGGTKRCRAPGADWTGTVEGDRVIARVRYPDGHLCGLTGRLEGTTISGEYSCNDPQDTDRGSWQIRLDTAGPDPKEPKQVF
jgi:hypothetical protein